MAIAVQNINLQAEKRIPSRLFLLYISFASMIMFFTSMFSALIVKRGDIKHWVEVPVPSAFLISTIIIVVSSFTLHYAFRNIVHKSKFQFFSILTLILALVFVYFQWIGWQEMKAKQVFFVGNPSGTFIYFISFMHGLHYLGGILFLALLIFRYRKSLIDDSKKLNFKILTQYWHFIGIVWVCIYLFFKYIIYK